ncbi:MAG: hydroxymethylbilane synthase, partial [Pseudomonadota bacterium]|nr:hydroxymethylbilane synthase [Pseudomonadota bacterium]
MTQKTLKLATRESLLALWQANYVKARLEALGHVVELLPIKTEGDKKLDIQLSKFGGKGLFLKELEQALLNGDADFAVHSMKDVPVLMPEGLEIAAICERESPFDALVSNTYSSFEALPKGAKVGTSSLRRTALLRQARPDLEIAFLRGNVQTRLLKLDAGEYDAIILAEAGLIRLKLEERIAQRLPRDICLPAVGQGALGIEICSKQTHIRSIIEQLADDQTQRCVQAERQVSLR